MKRFLIACAFLFVFISVTAFPVAAQDAAISPASYTPARATTYVELRSDASGIAALDTLSTTAAGEGQGTILDDLIAPLMTRRLPGVNFRADVLPWVGDRFALSAATSGTAEQTQDDFVFVLPIGDPAGAQAFVEQVTAGTAPQDAGSVQVYTLEDAKIAVGASVIWLGASVTVDSLFSFALENLSQNTAYQQVRAALPADTPVTLYLSGAFAANLVSSEWGRSGSEPGLEAIWQASLRLHPAQSAAENALLALPPLNGFGLAAQGTAAEAEFTLALSVNAQYPAPTLTTTSAGTTLLDLLPADSTAVFTSYDLMLPAVAGAWITALTTPVIGDTFSTVINNLNTTAATPTPTPTPQPITADMLLLDWQPAIRQIESTMGISLAELYPLVHSEYAFASFPDGAALYLQSANPQRLIDTLERVSHLLLTNPDPVEQLFTLEPATIANTPVTLVASPSLPERIALGILPGNVLFITTESSAERVIAAANDTTVSPLPPLRDQFGAAQESFFVVNGDALQTFSALVIGSGAPTPFSRLSGTLDVRDNGIFVLSLSAQ